MRRTFALLGALFGFGLGLHSACHGNCADAEGHCCANGHECHCADDPGTHRCQVIRSEWECTVAFIDEEGDEIGSESYLYENFAVRGAVEATCDSLQDTNPDRPVEAATAVCSCERIDGGPENIASPS